ncbi:MAG: hypothetical protein FJ087_11065 [Deltaproteobacteria bacterium]|nr:hypothetical protein [Deltaproteobacteria bacterium]
MFRHRTSPSIAAIAAAAAAVTALAAAACSGPASTLTDPVETPAEVTGLALNLTCAADREGIPLAGSLTLRDLGGFAWVGRASSYAPTRFSRDEHAWGTSLALPVGLSWTFRGPMSLAATGGPGVLFTGIADEWRTEPFASGALLLTVGR